MSKKNVKICLLRIKTQIVNTNKNILEKIKNLFKILALYIAPIIGGIFLPLIMHYHLLEKIYSFFSNNKHFYVLLYSIILLVVIFWERIQILKDYLKFPKFMKVFIDFVEFLLSLFFSLLFSIIYFLIIEKYTSFSIENNETTSFIFFTIIILTFFFISTINRRKIFNYIKNNNFITFIYAIYIISIYILLKSKGIINTLFDFMDLFFTFIYIYIFFKLFQFILEIIKYHSSFKLKIKPFSRKQARKLYYILYLIILAFPFIFF
ncbi:Integral membrane protein [Fusobacterium nucleatum subsp. nucleatum ATCC 25586]|uniref:Integral membrane protein n=1 Tax=Fusobacterium nucleatum subsp. nucleatum (strain ATCC 25586 / DSM 15643 / BCRC 10681 / CIP 101130 / JCM 8532 / KCTC 2640 / LMG 13131 / VPI 4355) TaxID=190304 RepID=Q8RE29_FUSNN|nr:Integral membrane protein [Fusobacterium nucleatum subsp. nucleatum ATCC 25586]